MSRINIDDQITILDGKEFKCDMCGECCRHVDKIPGISGLDRGDGVCKYLTEKNLCSIYNSRPNICRGEYLYRAQFSEMPVDEYYAMMYKFCEKLKEGVLR